MLKKKKEFKLLPWCLHSRGRRLIINKDVIGWVMAPHSSVLAWKIPWMEEPGRLQSMGSLRVRHD